MINRIKMFYETDRFDNLVETKPFLEYLRAESAKLRQEIKSGKLLEIGSGNGRLVPLLTDLVEEYYGIEISNRLHGEAVQEYGQLAKATLILGDASESSFPKSTFDHVLFAWNTYGNLYMDKDKILRKAIQVTKPGGKIYLSVLSTGALKPYLEMLRLNKIETEKINNDFVFLKEGLISERFSAEKLSRILSQYPVDFQIEPLTDIGLWCQCTKKCDS